MKIFFIEYIIHFYSHEESFEQSDTFLPWDGTRQGILDLKQKIAGSTNISLPVSHVEIRLITECFGEVAE